MSLFWSSFYFFNGLSDFVINIVVKYLHNQNKYWVLWRYQFDLLSFNNRAHALFEKINSSSLQITVTDKISKNIWNCEVFTALLVPDLQWVRSHKTGCSKQQQWFTAAAFPPPFFHWALYSFFMLWWFWLRKPRCPLTANEYSSVQGSAPVISEPQASS